MARNMFHILPIPQRWLDISCPAFVYLGLVRLSILTAMLIIYVACGMMLCMYTLSIQHQRGVFASACVRILPIFAFAFDRRRACAYSCHHMLACSCSIASLHACMPHVHVSRACATQMRHMAESVQILSPLRGRQCSSGNTPTTSIPPAIGSTSQPGCPRRRKYIPA